MQAIDLITLSLLEIGAYSQGETLSAGDASQAFTLFNLTLDEWSAREMFAYAMQFQQFTLPLGITPVTIGPGVGANFVVPQRPVRLEGASLNFNNTTPNIFVPIVIRDDQWWNYQRVPNLPSNIPTDVYYQPNFPNGSLFFWPQPNQQYPVRLEWWQSVAQVAALNTPLILPPAYAKALYLTLAIDLCPSFDKAVNPALASKQAKAIKAVQGNNAGSPRIQTAEAGQSGRGPIRADFNWVDGTPYGGGG